MTTEADHMRRALALAAAQLGRVAPNPAVGCVLVKAGEIVGEGATGEGGRPHAEEIALARAGAAAEGATAFVTLEPCAKRSTGAASCAARLVAARVARVLVAADDPHPNAAGEGYALLAQAGIAIERGLLRREAEQLNAGFFKVVREGVPLVAAADHAQGYDAAFAPMGDDLEAALREAARAGLTRLWVQRGSPLAARLAALGRLEP